jgi:phosphopantothenoylcysteine decarboxylase/phosphopantothenate--cysteine ligase
LGIALGRAAARAGHPVTLLIGPGVCWKREDLPRRCAVERFETAADLLSLLEQHFPQADLLVMAAAVADYRPQVRPRAAKMERREGQVVVLNLVTTPDLVAKMAKGKRPDQRVVAFALEEPAQLEQRAAAKLRSKGVDAVVANPLDTMDGRTIDALVLTARGGRLKPGRKTKSAFSRWFFEHLDEVAGAAMAGDPRGGTSAPRS